MGSTQETTPASQDALAQAFVAFSVESGVLRLGEFKTKAGRLSPYFFNAGLFDDGAKLVRLAQFYAQRILASGIEFDMVFGPAYKGIPLGAAVAMELARLGKNVGFAYNRKEVKDHGEGGSLVGAPLKGRVLIVDDVMSAGTAARESIALQGLRRSTPQRLESRRGGSLRGHRIASGRRREQSLLGLGRRCAHLNHAAGLRWSA